jgi:membrane-bound serine protease (ClpP class)
VFRDSTVPFAIAVVSPPAGAYAWLVAGIAGLVYAAYVPRSFVVGFAGAAAVVLASLGYLHVPPDRLGLAGVAIGVLLLNLEFLVPTFGAAAVVGLAAAAAGSWRLLATPLPALALPDTLRAALAITGTLALLIVTGRAARRYTLPRP